MRIALGSSSPRRRQLLEEAGFELLVLPPEVDETRQEGESPVALVERLARMKAQACLALPQLQAPGRSGCQAVIAADTVVWMPGRDVLGKPRDTHDAARMLRELSGRESRVSTGVCLAALPEHGSPRPASFVETTTVSFWELTRTQIDAYAQSGEPLDKAGAYGIQGRGRFLVRSIAGDYQNVVGLPVSRLVRELSDLLGDEVDLAAQVLGGAQ
ncbi:nucleoside triphosphate pyrophosphatase [uncultured Olsenella sp.]|uniref:nucleoside triphosphate pyrophosphatase n=1 Tax=uncultured Olsenella sp. TaxID=190764 RepID=UPI0034C6330D